MKPQSLYLLLATLLFLISCSRVTPKKDQEINHHLLFTEYAESIQKATNSLNASKDSLEIVVIIDSLDDILTKINYKFPPETDLYLTEQENDSIITLLERFTYLSHDKLNMIAKKNLVDSTLVEHENLDTINS